MPLAIVLPAATCTPPTAVASNLASSLSVLLAAIVRLSPAVRIDALSATPSASTTVALVTWVDFASPPTAAKPPPPPAVVSVNTSWPLVALINSAPPAVIIARSPMLIVASPALFTSAKLAPMATTPTEIPVVSPRLRIRLFAVIVLEPLSLKLTSAPI